MNSNLDQKKISAIEEALKLKSEGKRLSHIIEKFPNYESEIREVFGTVAFMKENADKVIVPKNILKTILSKIPDNSPIQIRPEASLKKEIANINNNFNFPAAEDDEDANCNDSSIMSEDNALFSKWKVIIPVIILGAVTGVILLRSDSRMKDKAINEGNKSSQNSDAPNSVPNANNISSSTDNNKI